MHDTRARAIAVVRHSNLTKAEFCRLRSVEHPTADLGKFRHQRIRISPSQRRGVYLGAYQDGRCQVSAAFKTKFIDPSWELKKFHNTATYTTSANRVLLSLTQVD